MNARVMGCGIGVAVGLLLAVSGCRNVDLPSADELNLDSGGRSPYVALDFSDGAPVALSAPLSFTANSLVGVDVVSVACGNVELASWPTPPYQAQVDLSPCVPFGQQTDAGEGILDLPLVASAVDKNGHRTDLTFHLRVDVSLPVLATNLGERIRPGQPLAFTLTSSIPLGALPQVTLADLPVAVTQDLQDARIFHCTLARTPELGIDALGDGGTVTLDVLQDVERTIQVKADAVAPNGNHGKLAQSVLLSRVLWDKPLPGPLAAEGAPFQPESLQAPTPVPEGLVVPLNGTITASSDFISAVFAADSGEVAVAQPLLDGGWAGFEIDAEGFVTARSTADAGGAQLPVATVYLDALKPASFAPTLDTPFELPVRVRGDGQLCGISGASPNPTGCAASTPSLLCLDHQGGNASTATVPLQTTADGEDGGTSQVVMARSGDRIFVGGYTGCGTQYTTPSYGVGTRDGGLTFSANTFPAPAGYNDCELAETYPVLPSGDGSFVLMPKVWCHTAAGAGLRLFGQPVLLVDPSGAATGSYAARSPWEPNTVGSVGILGSWGPAHDLMVLKPSLNGTSLLTYPADGGSASVASLIPGVYEYPPDQRAGAAAPPSLSMPRDVVRGTGGVSVLTEASAFTQTLVSLGSDLKPRWIYRYPRLSQGGTLHLYGLDDSGPLYLVDTFNLRVVAIER